MQLVALLILAVAGCHPIPKARPMRAEPTVEIVFSKNQYVLGEAVPAVVRYRNPTSHSLRMANPQKSTRVFMHAVSSKTKEDLSYPMVPEDQIALEPGTDRFVLSTPPAQPIDIPAGKSVEFVTDLNERLYLRPGKFACTLRQDDIASNQVTVEIVYEQSSVPHLIGYAAAADASYGRREWAMEWLQTLSPDFTLKLSGPEVAVAEREANEAFNRSQIEAFKRWHQQHRNDPMPPSIQR